MFAKSAIVVALLASFVVAQGTTANSTIDPSTITPTLRTQWCASQITVCTKLCSGNYEVNICQSSTFTFTCTCNNGTAPGLQYYAGSLDSLICEEVYIECMAAAVNDMSAQNLCIQNQNANCGSLDANDVASAAATSASSSTSSTLSSSSQSSTKSTSIAVSSSLSSSVLQSSSTAGPITSTNSPTSTSTSSTTTSSSTSAPSASAASQHKGLTTGAKAGIGVGAALGAILVLAIIAYSFYRLGQRKKPEPKTNAGPDVAELGGGRPRGAELSDGEPLTMEEKLELARRRRAAELDGTPLHEVMGGERAELEARRTKGMALHEIG